jgi:hypothetical protein
MNGTVIEINCRTDRTCAGELTSNRAGVLAVETC